MANALATTKKVDYKNVFKDVSVEIYFSHDQVGMTVESRLDRGDWQVVEFHQHADHKTNRYGWGEGKVMSTALDEKAYLDVLDKRGIKYKVVTKK